MLGTRQVGAFVAFWLHRLGGFVFAPSMSFVRMVSGMLNLVLGLVQTLMQTPMQTIGGYCRPAHLQGQQQQNNHGEALFHLTPV
jgi:hypothetical protein